ncbi:hypothetical protein NW762_004288 [Fusarium torreyae]|uniref:Uncharacterized protein n=1 Tax=Fusarium torreyae TaxID=1237075 RepID=A0A9W8S6I8_9HYPO|nr:hypothetical protein NW762_004288 [Fusarium torreyae]
MSIPNMEHETFEENFLCVDNEHDPVLLKIKELQERVRDCIQGIKSNNAAHPFLISSVSRNSSTSSVDSHGAQPSSSSIASTTTTTDKTFNSDLEDEILQAAARSGWQIAVLKTEWDDSIPAFCHPVPTAKYRGKPWREGCHPSVWRH